MSPQDVLTVGQDALGVMLAIGAPLLVTALVVGLAVSVLQAATQINEMTLSFIPSSSRWSRLWSSPGHG